MTADPNNPYGGKLEVLAPFHRAVDLTGWILFRPFDFAKWAVLAFAVFLSNCGHNIGPTYQGGNASGYGTASGFPPEFDEMMTTIGVSGMVLGVGIYIVSALLFVGFLWLASRMDFVTLDCIARNRGKLAPGWNEFHGEGNSLFLLRALLYGVTVPITLLMAFFMMGSMATTNMGGAYGQAPNMSAIFADMGTNLRALLMMLPLWGVFLLIQCFINYFVLPVMYARRLKAFAGFAHAWGLMMRHPGPVLLYLLAQVGMSIVVVLAVGIGSVLLGCALCVLACIPGLPQYVATFVALPLLAGLRTYSCTFVEQFGPDYQIFQHEVEFLALASEAPETATAERAYVPLPPQAGAAAPPPLPPPPPPTAWPLPGATPSGPSDVPPEEDDPLWDKPVPPDSHPPEDQPPQ